MTKSSLSLFFLILLGSAVSFGQARIMNPGVAFGQLVVLSEADVVEESDKYKALSPLSIPVFAELPLNLSVIAGAITLKEQNELSHVQIKSKARRTPNLDISMLPQALENPLFQGLGDGDWIEFDLTDAENIIVRASTEEAAREFYESRETVEINLQFDLSFFQILPTEELTWRDFDKVGSKAANYAELAQVLNTSERTVVRTGFGVPFYFYQQFVEQNAELARAVRRVMRDPLMRRVARPEYRAEKLSALREMIMDKDQTEISRDLLDHLVGLFDTKENTAGHKQKLKLRSSTNSEDLPNFNGAGLYTSKSYKPMDKIEAQNLPEPVWAEKSQKKKRKAVAKALRTVWASVWNQRAFEERQFFNIPHDQVYMGVQVNPAFSDEDVDGILVTTNVVAASRPEYAGDAVYLEVQRGDTHSVANPQNGVRPEKILVYIDRADPLNIDSYSVTVLQRSNIADDGETIMEEENPRPVISEDEVKDAVQLALKAEAHFQPILGQSGESFSLDLEFKVDREDTGERAVYYKQARPYIE